MATLDTLKRALRQIAPTFASSRDGRLSDADHKAGLEIIKNESGSLIYRDFIIPQLNRQLDYLLKSRSDISVLEVGPGPRTVFADVPIYLRRAIRKYDAYEPNKLFSASLTEWINAGTEADPTLPALKSPPCIRQSPFDPENEVTNSSVEDTETIKQKYDIVAFCHSLYGLTPKRRYIERALDLLITGPQGGIVVVFHRDGVLNFDGLVAHHMASFPDAVLRVADDDKTLRCFTTYVTGFDVQSEANCRFNKMPDDELTTKRLSVCRALGSRHEDHPGLLTFSAPDSMIVFNQHSTTLPELIAEVPIREDARVIKNREARRQHPACTFGPTEIAQIQRCVKWAKKYGFGLTVLGGGHSDHCVLSNVVCLDMSSFDKVHIGRNATHGALIIVDAGCNTGGIVRVATEAGLALPLGARPSVGAGLWLQGGIGHQARLHGLACDSIIGAVMVNVGSGELLYVGCVPREYRPPNAHRPKNDLDLLWAIRGAGSNVGIVLNVVFRAHEALTFEIRHWSSSLSNNEKTRLRLSEVEKSVDVAVPGNLSVDAFLYHDDGQLQICASLYQCYPPGSLHQPNLHIPTQFRQDTWNLDDKVKGVDGIGLFDTELYISTMHGGHGGGKTSSFKRCVFLKGLGRNNVADCLEAIMRRAPTPLCYIHLLQGGGAVRDIPADGTAFGCRDWDYASVLTGVWRRDQDGSKFANAAVQWVYDAAKELISLTNKHGEVTMGACVGVYGADLGPDPRDASLAPHAFGANRAKLANIKHQVDPYNILRYSCPISTDISTPLKMLKCIFIITGASCAGKDHFAKVCCPIFLHRGFKTKVSSISDATKIEYAAATGADLDLLLYDRQYKENHRPALTFFFKEQVIKQPNLPVQHFLSLVANASDQDVLFITGMRDAAPVASYAHHVPSIKVVEIHITADCQVRRDRGSTTDPHQESNGASAPESNLAASDHRPTFVFEDNSDGDAHIQEFAEHRLLPHLCDGIQQLSRMIHHFPGFPRPEVDFCHVLGIAQQPGGLELCTELLHSHFSDDWSKVGAIVSCETGGFIFAPTLAVKAGVPMVPVREASKLPPPTVTVMKPSSHISSLVAESGVPRTEIGMSSDTIPAGSKVVVVDDVLASGMTLYAVLQLLVKAGVRTEDVSVLVVAEFPIHRGREMLHKKGFGKVGIQSLVVIGTV
ncbi:hypothetical protein BU24DRAFT_423394 [Aaosphaeria arxii CBS 175.79]|uniref:FAD-binding PCMH-type domain-containing protein n=1 Tax=Aaosphaeria arxii CBS 175.79 TaxID=1450172 RepID=A0A6A5XMI7_9PLEO|nr:uncharacterized protein BU24DRAFT_423394 [Aaosphaeria arxii CBS 175.79]KAF2014458.1 hypothetical protein BU24DRAFT_423394 [Aaosphaeria arxii CBS 175.79]